MRMPLSSLAVLLSAACGATIADDLADGTMLLPHVLREVSGIVALDADTVACVQDEHGAIFIVDLTGHRELRVHTFGKHGDYEGLTRAGDNFWVLRSDGLLERLAVRNDRWTIVASHWLPSGHRQWEALCFDPERDRLLVMPKDGAGEDKDSRDLRPILAVDPHTGALAPEPVLVLNRRTLMNQAGARGIELPTHTTAKGKERVALELACSELAVVPGTRDLLLLSAVDGVLLRVDEKGGLLACRRLDATQLPQPEGMTFLPDGRLLIASEGRGGPARLVVVPLP